MARTVRIKRELAEHSDRVDDLRAHKGPVTLVYRARDQQHNNAVVLAELVKSPG